MKIVPVSTSAGILIVHVLTDALLGPPVTAYRSHSPAPNTFTKPVTVRTMNAVTPVLRRGLLVLWRGCQSLTAPSEEAQGGPGRGEVAMPVPVCHWGFCMFSPTLLPDPPFPSQLIRLFPDQITCWINTDARA